MRTNFSLTLRTIPRNRLISTGYWKQIQTWPTKPIWPKHSLVHNTVKAIPKNKFLNTIIDQLNGFIFTWVKLTDLVFDQSEQINKQTCLMFTHRHQGYQL